MARVQSAILKMLPNNNGNNKMSSITLGPSPNLTLTNIIIYHCKDTNFWGSAYITYEIIVIASTASWLPEPMTS
ncbi:hypothetical protein LINPERHAP2_LOCUS36591 [Linum perenne]